VLELSIDEALAMIGDGRIADAKTIMLLHYAVGCALLRRDRQDQLRVVIGHAIDPGRDLVPDELAFAAARSAAPSRSRASSRQSSQRSKSSGAIVTGTR
jgi:hypothetical protein